MHIAELQAWAREGTRPDRAGCAVPGEPPHRVRPSAARVGRRRATSEDSRPVAIVGTRRPTEGGVTRAQSIARHLVASGYTVVSGLAAGIDTSAHTATLAAGGRTFAVIGTGLRRAYPKENVDLQARVASESAVTSQFLPDAPLTKSSFPMRNGVMRSTLLREIGEPRSVSARRWLHVAAATAETGRCCPAARHDSLDEPCAADAGAPGVPSDEATPVRSRAVMGSMLQLDVRSSPCPGSAARSRRRAIDCRWSCRPEGGVRRDPAVRRPRERRIALPHGRAPPRCLNSSTRRRTRAPRRRVYVPSIHPSGLTACCSQDAMQAIVALAKG